MVQPDILFISNERLNIIGEKNARGAPDLIIEIISEKSAYKDTVKKKHLYERFGVKEYWIVFPNEEIIEIYTLKNNTYQPYKTFFKENNLTSQVLKGLKMDLKKIFSKRKKRASSFFT